MRPHASNPYGSVLLVRSLGRPLYQPNGCAASLYRPSNPVGSSYANQNSSVPEREALVFISCPAMGGHFFGVHNGHRNTIQMSFTTY